MVAIVGSLLVLVCVLRVVFITSVFVVFMYRGGVAFWVPVWVLVCESVNAWLTVVCGFVACVVLGLIACLDLVGFAGVLLLGFGRRVGDFCC